MYSRQPTSDAFAQQRHMMLLEDLNLYICYFDPSGSLLLANQTYQQVVPHKFFPPNKPITFDHLFASHQWEDVRTDANIIGASGIAYTFESWVSATRRIQWRLRPLHDQQGIIREYQLLGTDVSAPTDDPQMTQTLLEVSSQVHGKLHLEQTLDAILSGIARLIPHDMANVMLIKEGYTRVVGMRGYDPDAKKQLLQTPFRVTASQRFSDMLNDHQPVIINDVHNYSGWIDNSIQTLLRSYLGVPIVADNEVIGFINLDSAKPDQYTTHHAAYLQRFADQAAVAIKNARLYRRTQEITSLEERQRLARSLHDAVNQTLFSATIMAEAAKRLYENNASELPQVLDELHKTTQGALSEMRSLLIELNPDTLLETDLDTLLRQLAHTFQVKNQMAVALHIEGQTPPPGAVKVVIYRLCQQLFDWIIPDKPTGTVDIQLQLDVQHVVMEFITNTATHNISPDRYSKLQELAVNIGGGVTLETNTPHITKLSFIWVGASINE